MTRADSPTNRPVFVTLLRFLPFTSEFSVSLRCLICCVCVLLLLPILGCSGGNEPVNKDLDKPIPSKKDKDK